MPEDLGNCSSLSCHRLELVKRNLEQFNILPARLADENWCWRRCMSISVPARTTTRARSVAICHLEAISISGRTWFSTITVDAPMTNVTRRWQPHLLPRLVRSSTAYRVQQLLRLMSNSLAPCTTVWASLAARHSQTRRALRSSFGLFFSFAKRPGPFILLTLSELRDLTPFNVCES